MISKKELSAILTKQQGRKINVVEIKPVGSGFHADGYMVLTEGGENYFIKRIKAEDVGFEFPERKVMSLMVSHAMANRKDDKPKSLGVIVKDKKVKLMPEIGEQSEVYHLQEWAGEGKSYLSILDENAKKKEMNSQDKEEIDRVLDFIISLHQTKHPSNDSEKLKAVYDDAMRAIIGHPERLLEILQSIPQDSEVLSPKQQGEFIALMLENMHHFKGRHERVVALHGDFWGANVFFRKDGSMFVIDYSRTPWGDPGHDVGIWMSQYLFRYYQGNKKYFRQLGDYFLSEYIRRTKDKEIVKTMVYPIGIIAGIYASPTTVKGIDPKVRKALYGHVVQMLKRKEFFWE